MDEPNSQPSWQMTPPQGKPLYTFDTHDTEKLYTKRFFLLNRTRLLLLVLDLVIILTWFAHILNLGRFTLLFSLFVVLVSYFLVRSRAKASYKRQQRIQTGLTHYTIHFMKIASQCKSLLGNSCSVMRTFTRSVYARTQFV